MTATGGKDGDKMVEEDRAGATPTPNGDGGQARRFGGFATLTEGLDFAARGETGLNFHVGRGELAHVLPYAALRERALALAGRLHTAGLRRGDRLAILAETTPDFMSAFFACQYAGILPCPVSLPVQMGGRDSYVEKVAGMLRAAAARGLLASEDYLAMLRPAAVRAGTPLVLSHEALRALPEAMDAIAPFRPDEAAYIQYSSGSTSAPKGILISQRAIMANTTGILRHGLKVRADDRAFSWLPLYHDMGLVGFFLTPMMGQVSVDYMPTFDFVKRPGLWLKLMSEAGSSICFAPSFGYDLAARRVNGKAARLDLSRWRIAGIGGDMVRADVLEAFARALAPAGFDAKAFLPSYGMAEMSLAISFSELDAPVRLDTIDRALAERSGMARPVDPSTRGARTFVSCGRVLPGHELKVADEKGNALPERHIGRVLVKGPSMMSGYYGRPEETARVIDEDGYLDTGDLGYLLDGEIYITGRSKDMILHNGRNIWPQDIEWVVERKVEAMRSGDVAAFGVEDEDGGERVVVLVQCRLRKPSAQEELRRQVARAVHEALGVECEVVLVAPRSLPQTSSGKLSRRRARALYLAGELPPPPTEAAERKREAAMPAA